MDCNCNIPSLSFYQDWTSAVTWISREAVLHKLLALINTMIFALPNAALGCIFQWNIWTPVANDSYFFFLVDVANTKLDELIPFHFYMPLNFQNSVVVIAFFLSYLFVLFWKSDVYHFVSIYRIKTSGHAKIEKDIFVFNSLFRGNVVRHC